MIKDIWKIPKYAKMLKEWKKEQKRLEEEEEYNHPFHYYNDLKNVMETSFEEGLKKGEEKGRKETQIDIAKEMKAQGFDIASIVKVTKLSEEEIRRL